MWSVINKISGFNLSNNEPSGSDLEHLTEPKIKAFNYIIEHRVPEVWAEGIRSAILKAGNNNVVNNYRGTSIVPIVEKVFEVAVYRRLSFANETFNRID